MLGLVCPAAPCPEDPEERARQLRAQLARVPANRRTEVLQALSLVWRSRGQLKSKRLGDAALALAALLLEDGLSGLAAGANGADPGALLLGLVEAAARDWPLLAGAHYEARAAWRKQKQEAKPGPLPEKAHTPHHEERLDRRAALAKLSPAQRELLALAAEGLTDQEIAARVGSSAGAVRIALYRARTRLEKIA